MNVICNLSFLLNNIFGWKISNLFYELSINHDSSLQTHQSEWNRAGRNPRFRMFVGKTTSASRREVFGGSCGSCGEPRRFKFAAESFTATEVVKPAGTSPPDPLMTPPKSGPSHRFSAPLPLTTGLSVQKHSVLFSKCYKREMCEGFDTDCCDFFSPWAANKMTKNLIPLGAGSGSRDGRDFLRTCCMSQTGANRFQIYFRLKKKCNKKFRQCDNLKKKNVYFLLI